MEDDDESDGPEAADAARRAADAARRAEILEELDKPLQRSGDKHLGLRSRFSDMIFGQKRTNAQDRLTAKTLRVHIDEATVLLPETGGPRRSPDLALVRKWVSPLACDTWRELDRALAPQAEFVVIAFGSADEARQVRKAHYDRWKDGKSYAGSSPLRLEYGRRCGRGEGWSREEQNDRLCITGVWAESGSDALEVAATEVNKCLHDMPGLRTAEAGLCERYSANAKQLTETPPLQDAPHLVPFRVWLTVYGEEQARHAIEHLPKRGQLITSTQGGVPSSRKWRVSGSGSLSVCLACGGRGHSAGSGECWKDKYVLRVDSSMFLHRVAIDEFVQITGASRGFAGMAPRHQTRNMRPKKWGHLVFDDELSRMVGAVILTERYYPPGVLSIPTVLPNGVPGMPPCCPACGLVDLLATEANLQPHRHGTHPRLCPASGEWEIPGGTLKAYLDALKSRERQGSTTYFWNGSFWASAVGDLSRALEEFSIGDSTRKKKTTGTQQGTVAGRGRAGTPAANPSAGGP